jgi:mono/diheme cytochrome c family protein
VTVLARVDKAFAAITWLIAALIVLMLLFGPAVVAHDQTAPAGASPYGSGAPSGGPTSDAKTLFTSNCGSCHTLKAAGTTGQVGPDLDQVSVSPAQVANQIRQGGGAMPGFAGRLSDAQIRALAAFVARSH